MSDQSLSPETAFTVASTFLAYYYSEFVKLNELARMSDLYDERSYMTLVDFRDEVPVVAHGRNSVASLLAKLDSTLGQRKVEIITVDTVSLPHNCVQVICQGVMYLREYRRVFLHVFILEPTAYRTKTYHIASDYLRFVDSEKEVIPPGSVVIAADQVDAYLEESRLRMEQEQRRQFLEFQQRIRQQQQLQMQQQKAAAETAAKMSIPAPASREGRTAAAASRGPSQPQEQQYQRAARPPRDGARPPHGEDQREPRGERRNRDAPRDPRDGPRDVQREPRENRSERKPREPREPRGERKPRERDDKDAAPSPNRPSVEGKKGTERSNRKPTAPAENAVKVPTGGAAPAAAPQAPATERRPPRESGPSAAIIMLRVPKKIKLSDIKAELLGQGIAAPADLFWFGRESAHAVAKFSVVEEATAVIQKLPFSILGETVKMNYFHE